MREGRKQKSRKQKAERGKERLSDETMLIF